MREPLKRRKSPTTSTPKPQDINLSVDNASVLAAVQALREDMQQHQALYTQLVSTMQQAIETMNKAVNALTAKSTPDITIPSPKLILPKRGERVANVKFTYGDDDIDGAKITITDVH